MGEVVVLEAEVVDAVLAPTTGAGPAMQATRPPADVLRVEWQRAFEQWIEDAASSQKTIDAYRVAWRDLWKFVIALPSSKEEGPHSVAFGTFWEISHRHIRAWIADLETRPLDPRRVATVTRRGGKRRAGYSASTINQRLAAISSFYSYAENNWPVQLPNGQDVPLTLLSYMTMNPVKVIKRKVKGASRDQAYLSLEQLRAFLSAIPRTTLVGLRDRALFSLYIMTGARNTEARTLTRGDFQERGGRWFWYWRGKGRGRTATKEGWKELPPEVWEAINIYLLAAGRVNGDADEYIFTAVTDRARNLPTVDAETWNPYGQPLSSREVNRLVKRYAKRAGLDPDEVHVHTLRHSAAMLMDEVGAGVEDIRQFLNHESLNTTQRYLHEKRGQRNVHAGKMAEALRL